MRLFASLIITAVVIIAILAAQNQLPHFIKDIINMHNGDKVLHFLLIGSCNGALLVLVNYNRTKHLLKVSALVTIISLVISTAEEFSQRAFPHRSFSYKDMLANYSGILFFGIIITGILFYIQKRKAHGNSEQ